MAKYSFEFKMKIVYEYIEGKGGTRFLSIKYGVKSYKTGTILNQCLSRIWQKKLRNAWKNLSKVNCLICLRFYPSISRFTDQICCGKLESLIIYFTLFFFQKVFKPIKALLRYAFHIAKLMISTIYIYHTISLLHIPFRTW